MQIRVNALYSLDLLRDPFLGSVLVCIYLAFKIISDEFLYTHIVILLLFLLPNIFTGEPIFLEVLNWENYYPVFASIYLIPLNHIAFSLIVPQVANCSYTSDYEHILRNLNIFFTLDESYYEYLIFVRMIGSATRSGEYQISNFEPTVKKQNKAGRGPEPTRKRKQNRKIKQSREIYS